MLSFEAPELLGFLAALPALWWLLRLTPPAPRKFVFPPLALLQGLTARIETPSRTPWWLLLLRLVCLGLLIAAMARPVLDPVAATTEKGALLLVIDNDWAAARDWQSRSAIIADIMQNAAHNDQPVALLTTTPDTAGHVPVLQGPMTAAAAQGAARAITPFPWPADWAESTERLNAFPGTISRIVWLASGAGNAALPVFHDALSRHAPTTVYATHEPLLTLSAPAETDGTLSIAAMRADTDDALAVAVNALDDNGHVAGRWPLNFASDAPRASVTLDIPAELRGHIARFEIDRGRSAASTFLMGDAWQPHAIGITGDAAELERHSLLSEIYYLDRALKPFAARHIAPLPDLMNDDTPVILMTDAAGVPDELLPGLTAWMKHGGVLVRFAGERFAGADHAKEQDILPVGLRYGGRAFGGAMSWGTPQPLKEFPTASPFHGIEIPADVNVSRQILAEPTADMARKSWAVLADGTPLVTAMPVGQGLSVLFHVPAQTGWSNLPLSGLFVEMLQKISKLGHGKQAASGLNGTLRPQYLLNAFGDGDGSLTASDIDTADAATLRPSPLHPPGVYGNDTDQLVLNLSPSVSPPQGIGALPTETYAFSKHGHELQPWLIVAAFILLAFDFLISLKVRGLLHIAAMVLALLASMPAEAATTAAELTGKTYLAYVVTGDSGIDHVSEQGLAGLARVLERRTAVDEAGVAAVNPDTDDVSFFPFLYWPTGGNQKPLSAEGARRISYYLRHGGMILFDGKGSDDNAPLFMNRVLAGVDLPPLIKLPEKHALKRSFYLLDAFPGRFADHEIWIEPAIASTYDGVSSVIYGSNDWAAAWAADSAGNALYPCIPGGEAQRERAFRFGVNLAIYALTGTYKTNQMNAQQLLQRM